MLYLNTDDLKRIEIPWEKCLNLIDQTAKYIQNNKFSQPIKPYVSFDNPQNRIIAMPARIGSGNEGNVGIKWIASFPENIHLGKDRAHAVTILNDINTGEAISIINSGRISAIRTASVSGFFLDQYLKQTGKSALKILLIGHGPIGKMHLKMIDEYFTSISAEIDVYDKRHVKLPLYNHKVKSISKEKMTTCFSNYDLVITCTTSTEGYINLAPKTGSLHLNISLRDYHYSMQKYFSMIIVDNWEEVCRADTDIEIMSKKNNLTKDQTIPLHDIKTLNFQGETVFFNPMGMAGFDIAIGSLFSLECSKKGIGKNLK